MPKNISSVMWSLTYDCNMVPRCNYCFQVEGGLTDGYVMSQETIDATLKFLSAQKIEKVNFFGGEPLVVWDEISSILPQLDFPSLKTVGMTTNGVGLDIEKVLFLRKFPLKFLISLDGLEHVHNKFRNNWIDTVKGILLLKNNGCQVATASTVYPEMIDDWYLGLQFMNLLGVDNLKQNRIGHWLTPWNIPKLRKEWLRVGEWMLRHYPRIQVFPLADTLQVLDQQANREGFSRRSCGSCFGSLAIDPRGNLIACQASDQVVGNVWDGIDMDKVNQIRKIDYPECHLCPVLVCSRCHISGNTNEHTCTFNKVRYETALRLLPEYQKLKVKYNTKTT